MWHALAAIDGKYPDRSGTLDGLAYVTGLGTGIGFDGFKLELSTAYASKYAHNTWGTPATLAQLLAATPMANVLANPAIVRFAFNTFSLAVTTNNPWAYAWTDTIGDAIEAEFYDACALLRSTYPDKHFLMQSWESDWQLLNGFDPSNSVPMTRLQAYRDYSRRRQRALTKARADNPGGTGSIRYAIECNRVLDDYGARIHRNVLPNMIPDVVGLSIYEAIEGWLTISNQAALEADITTKLTNAVARVRAELPTTPIVISEYGFPQDAPYFPGALDVPALHAKILQVADGLGVEGVIPWQATDNEELSAGVPRGFGMWRRNGSSTTVGAISDVGAYWRDSVL